jgi:hypothetical protein
MDMGHNVVAKFLFVSGGLFEIDIVKVFCHLGYLGLLDIQAELFLRLCQFQPQSAPSTELSLRPEKLSHFS